MIKVNDTINEAFRARDAAAYEANTAPEFVRISSFGGVTPRADFVKNAVLGGTGTRLGAASDEMRVRVYGDVAVATYRNLRNNERMMGVFVNRGGAWKAVAAISTRIWNDTME
ncbi:MAG: nuclear transport factor 2 family protein [Acidobacteriota bacterium]|nr:nuclear transport factor 2 family protein [Acidobacteriota bacterium]